MRDVPGLLARNIEELRVLLPDLADLAAALDQATTAIRDCLLGGGKLLIFGNGGSATDASHFAAEFVIRYHRDRPGYPAIALGDSGGVVTACANDYSFEDVFARQVRVFGRHGDVAIGLSTSGNSVNVRRAIEEANALGMTSIAFLGKGGGSTRGLATIDLLVPHTVTARIQEAHKLLIHTICEALEDDLATELA